MNIVKNKIHHMETFRISLNKSSEKFPVVNSRFHGFLRSQLSSFAELSNSSSGNFWNPCQITIKNLVRNLPKITVKGICRKFHQKISIIDSKELNEWFE